MGQEIRKTTLSEVSGIKKDYLIISFNLTVSVTGSNTDSLAITTLIMHVVVTLLQQPCCLLGLQQAFLVGSEVEVASTDVSAVSHTIPTCLLTFYGHT